MKRISTQLSGELTTENKLTLGWEKKGRMLVYQNDDSFKDGIETLNSLKQYGVTGDILDSDGVREKDPNLLPSVVGGIYYPGYES